MANWKWWIRYPGNWMAVGLMIVGMYLMVVFLALGHSGRSFDSGGFLSYA